MSLRHLAPLLLLISCLASAAPQDYVQTFPLHHRQAAELLTLVRPLFPELLISGSERTLVARGPFDQLTRLEATINQLDVAPVELLVALHRGALPAEAEGRANVKIYGTEPRRPEEQEQRLRVVEGRWARLQTGILQPSVGGSVRDPSLTYQPLGSGFEVRPRLTGGERVTLEIRPYRQQAAAQGGGAIATQELATTVSGRLGEWIQLSGAPPATTSDAHHNRYATGRRRQQQFNDLYVKIERLE